jgi:hypothetical protein
LDKSYGDIVRVIAIALSHVWLKTYSRETPKACRPWA